MDPAVMRQAVMKALNTWPEHGAGSHGPHSAHPPGTKYRPASREELSAEAELLTSSSSRESSRTLLGNHQSQQVPSLYRKAPQQESYHRDITMERRSPRRSDPSRSIPRKIGVGSETLPAGHSASPASWQRAPEDPTPTRESPHHQFAAANEESLRFREQVTAPPGSVADFKGVMLSSDQKSFVSFVACMGATHFVGHFGSAFEAAIAHDNAVLRLLGPEAAPLTNYYGRAQGPTPRAAPAAAERRDSNEEEQNAAKERFLEDLFASRSANFSFHGQMPRSTTMSESTRDSYTSELQALHATAFEQALMLHSARSFSGRQSKTATGRDPTSGQPPISAPTALPFGQRGTFDGSLGKQRQYRSSSTIEFHPGNAETPTERPREADSKKRNREPPSTSKASPTGDQLKPPPKKRGRPKLEDSENGGVKSSRFRGVSWNKKDDKWQAMIFAKGKARWIGYFKQEEDAARAYDREALAERGPRALLNFPLHAAPEDTSK